MCSADLRCTRSIRESQGVPAPEADEQHAFPAEFRAPGEDFGRRDLALTNLEVQFQYVPVISGYNTWYEII